MSAPDTSPMRVLIVDDDMVLRMTMQSCLTAAGFETVEAACGKEGLERFHECPADIVLLDVVMPDMDGFAVCRALREAPGGAHVPVLMVTGSNDVDSVTRAFEAGATDFTGKPINPDLLVHRVQFALRAKQTADQLRDREASLAHAQRIARVGTFELDLNDQQLRCSETLNDIWGVSRASISLDEFLSRVVVRDRDRVAAALQADGLRAVEYRVERDDGEVVTVLQNADMHTRHEHQVVGSVQDVTEQRATEERIRQLAYFDPVTSLPNRSFLAERLDNAIVRAKADGTLVAALFIDLDDFKRINDTWGYSVGDELLDAVGQRLSHGLREHDVVSRPASAAAPTVACLGGDEFVIILTALSEREDAEAVAARVNAVLKEPFMIRDTEVFLGGSVGISVYPDDASDAETLLRNADGAMYEAKADGRNLHRFYTDAIRDRAYNRLSMESRMRRGLEREEFELHYQPKVALENGRTIGLEALLRWHCPESGNVRPDQFIPVAEATGLVVPIGAWVLDAACAQARRWRDGDVGPLTVAVNLSAAQFAREDLVRTVADALERHDLEPSLLELELTESLLMADTSSTLKTVAALKELGVSMSIDDFGTGFSSLSYLKRLPVDRLKIDRCFVTDMESDRDDEAIVRATVALAHSLRLGVIAEGVETTGQARMLRELGCDEVQGFLYSRPLPPRDLEDWLAARRQSSGAASSPLRIRAAG